MTQNTPNTLEQPAPEPDSSLRPAFFQTLARHGLELRRDRTLTLQVNVGLLCNQTCRHCHLEAGPDRQEMMTQEIMEQVAAYAVRGEFQVADVTGGAPELVPHIDYLLKQLAASVPKVMLRANLTAISEASRKYLGHLCRDLRITLVASLPALHVSQTDAQRGSGVLAASIAALQWLNSLGYGQTDSGLELNLVSNPGGAFLPPDQCRAETRFRRELLRKWGVHFNNLYTFANMPLGRFRSWLMASGNYEGYMQRLTEAFNPATVSGVMCRSLVSVNWEGVLHDCDFHLARRIPLGGIRRHVAAMSAPPAPGSPVVTAEHCYACTAGAGFT